MPFLYCWGSNTHGQRAVPWNCNLNKQKIISVSAGAAHTCAIVLTNYGKPLDLFTGTSVNNSFNGTDHHGGNSNLKNRYKYKNKNA
mmetsp:Transcript_30602/g.25827  ORF Transcript_30602/g.25827 Transcript_30602/m.25827 type:complete len:86 (-) Transcript_30602:329-586(-)